MLNHLSHAWRVLATGFCFLSFGLGGLLLGVLVFPLIRLLWKEPQHCSRRARWVIQRTFRFFIGMMQWLGVLSYEVRDAHRLHRRGLLILANHPSLIDVVFLMALVNNADCIVKASLARNPATWGPVTAAGFVFNDSGVELIDDCLASIHAGKNLIIFPEGTRTPRDGEMRLQRGAANVAIRGGINITPVRITVQPPTLGKNEPWYSVPLRRPHFVFQIESDIAVDGFRKEADSEPLAARRLTDFLTHYFSTEVSYATT